MQEKIDSAKTRDIMLGLTKDLYPFKLHDVEKLTEQELKVFIERAKEEVGKFVLKPKDQGPKRHYDKEVPLMLAAFTQEQKSQYFLEEIEGEVPFLLTGGGRVWQAECDMEVGYFGFMEDENNKIVRNEVTGYAIRKRQVQYNEAPVLGLHGALATWVTSD